MNTYKSYFRERLSLSPSEMQLIQSRAETGSIKNIHFTDSRFREDVKIVFCSNCGKEIEDEGNFCPHCGAPRLENCETPTAAQEGTFFESEEISPAKKKKHGKAVMVFRVCAILLILTGVAAFWLWPQLSQAGTSQSKLVTTPLFPKETGLLSAMKDGKWGYIDKTGEFVIDPVFESVKRFSANGLAAAQEWDENESGKWGFIDKTGHFVIEPAFENTYGFSSEGIAAVEEDGKWGIIREDGNYQIEPRLLRAYVMYGFEGPYLVQDENEKWGYISQDGSFVIEPVFSSAGMFSINGLAPVQEWSKEGNGEIGYVDATGLFKIRPKFLDAQTFSDNGLAMVRMGEGDYNNAGYINAEGDFVIPPFLHLATPFRFGLACGSYYGSDGEEVNVIIDETGEIVAESTNTYDIRILDAPSETISPGNAQLGLFAISVRKGDEDIYGFINQGGEIVIQPQYEDVGGFGGKKPLVPVVKDGKLGYLDAQGNVAIDFIFDGDIGDYDMSLWGEYNFHNDGYATVRQNGKWGVIDETGKFLIDPIFEDICNERASY